MVDSFRIETAREGDSGAILALLRASFPESMLRLTIYGRPAVARFIEGQIAAQALGGDSTYLVARVGNELAGFVHLCRKPASLFLNFICTDPGYARQGIATRLLRDGVQRCGKGRPGLLTLDVEEHLVMPRFWYDRLGFRTQHAVEWWVVVGSSRVDLQACKLEYSIVSPK